MTPTIVFLDIETAPNLGWVWGKWEQNVIDFKAHWYILSFAIKWQGSKNIPVYSLPDYPKYDKNREDDRALVKELWHVFDRADVIIGHNIDKFDARKAHARFVAHGLPPPAPYKTVDTLKLARKHFAFDSNKLDDLGGYLGVGRKLPNTGRHLWFGCMNGDAKSWDRMVKYNMQDVALVERVYGKLAPYSTTHPNLTYFTRADKACPVCQHPKSESHGWRYTRTGKNARRRCLKCSHTFQYGPHVKYAA